MIVVDQVLVVGIRVARFEMAVVDTESIVDGFEYRYHRVGGAAGRRENSFLGVDLVVVDTEYNVGDVVLAGGGKNDF